MKLLRHLVVFMLMANLTVGAFAQNQSPLSGSVATGTVSAQRMGLSLSDAIDRGLRYNLAVLSGTQDERNAAAIRLRTLYDFYPKVRADISSIQQQINLAAFGFTGFPGQKSIVGPFALIDARARMTQSVYDRKLVYDLRQAEEGEKAVAFNNDNTRELVVLTVANLYLQGLAASSRITAAEAQVKRAQTLFNRTQDMKNAGVVPGIDVLRAQVELQNQQQRLLAYRNDFAQQKLTLARAIGIPLGQEINLTDRMPSDTPQAMTLEAALQAANANRADLKRADALKVAAERAIDSARAENLPTLDFSADYGVIGRTPGQSHGTYSMRGAVNIPLFNSSRSKTDLQAASARLDQRKLELDDLKGRVELEVRAAYLELKSSDEQVKVATSSVDLARRQLDQAQDRFEAGVANNLEVVQAQEALALSDENLIASLYALNVAKATLARATGNAEQTVKAFLGGNK